MEEQKLASALIEAGYPTLNVLLKAPKAKLEDAIGVKTTARLMKHFPTLEVRHHADADYIRTSQASALFRKL